jgi:hypothetical protein
MVYVDRGLHLTSSGKKRGYFLVTQDLFFDIQ